jgi:alpha-mannosidase
MRFALLLLLCSAPLTHAAENAWLKGYAKTVSGETIGYHSPYPEATSALLVRATDGRMSAAWETAPVPDDFSAPVATFVWMAGLATQKGAHAFFLSVDDEPLLAFHTGKDASEKSWEIPGKNGATLTFKTTLVDQFQELFGFMFLTLPKSSLRPGKPVRLKVAGENGGSRDWFMVFQYDLEPWVRASAEQALVRKGDKLSQSIRVEISHIGPPEEAVISAGGGEKMTARIETGYNVFYLPVEGRAFAAEAAAREKDIAVSVGFGGRPSVIKTIKLRPVAPREIWLLPHSHVDIGYSDPQAVVEKNHWRYFEEAIELARRTENYPPGARFKWNVEVLWAVETYLRQATPGQRDAFLEAVKKGWIGLQALLANELTGICHPEELYHLTEFARLLSRRYGLAIDSAMITDIPSYTWSLVPALAQSGVKYFSSGPNYMPNLPDSGDRIGHAFKNWRDRPFYWVSPSAKEKVLFWMAGRGYSWFHGLNMGSLSFEKRQPIFDYLRELADSGYPYDMVQVRYTTGGDNGPPDPNLSDFVKKWNEEYESPKFVIATSREMFEEFERRYGNRLPSVRGDFTPYWEDGAASTALETAMNRASANRLLQAETLWAMFDPANCPAPAFYEAWRQVVLFDEHTWGAADSVSDPDGENAKIQWAYKRSFALEGRQRSEGLLAAALKAGKKGEPAREVILVANTNSWEISDVVMVPAERSLAGDLVEDEQGRPVPSQRLSNGEMAVQALCIPPFGAKKYTVLPGRALCRGDAAAGPRKLANGRLSIAVNPRSGAVSNLTWKSSREIEFANAAGDLGLNAYLYVPGRDPQKAQGVHQAKISVKEPGPLVASLLVESDAPGCAGLKRELRVYSGLDRLDLIDQLDKKGVREKESVHIAFPFAVAGGTIRVDLGWGTIRPEADQIPGSCKDFFCAQNAVDISNADYGVTWVSLDAPLAEIGRMTDETIVEKGVRSWRKEFDPSQTIYSYAMNNYWHTNYKADQPGPVTLRYSLRPHEGNDPAEITKFGMERARPLIVAPAKENFSAPMAPLALNPGVVVVTSLKPSADGKAWIARVYNPSARPADVVFSGVPGGGGTVFLSDPFEDRLEKIEGSLRLSPAESVMLRIER